MTEQYIERALVLIGLKRHAQAEKELKKALSLEPQHARALALFGLVLHLRHQYYPAIHWSEKAIAAEVNDPMPYFVLGESYRMVGKHKKAKETAALGLQIAPYDDRFFALNARLAADKFRWKVALKESEKGLALAPNSADLLAIRANALYRLKKWEAANGTLDQALHLDSINSDAIAEKGWLALEASKFADALTHFQQSLQINPVNPDAVYGLQEAIVGEKWWYRLILKSKLWFRRHPEATGAILIGTVAPIGSQASSIFGAMGWGTGLLFIMVVLGIIFALFLFFKSFFETITQLSLLFHPIGKRVASKETLKKMGIWLVMSLLTITLCTYIFIFIIQE